MTNLTNLPAIRSNMEHITTTVDHISQQSDRWLFIGCLVLGAIAAYFAFRWLVGQFISQTTRLAEVVERNTEALREVKTVVADTKETMSYCRLRNMQDMPK